MMKKWLVGLVACASLLGARAVAAEKLDFDQGIDVKHVLQSLNSGDAAAREVAGAPVQAASRLWPWPSKADWTVMVYINAKNNLESYGLFNVNQMEMVGSTSKVKVAVELGRLGTYSSADGGWRGQRRYIIEKDNDTDHISSPALQDIAQADMGDWRHLVDFVAWAKKAAPAKRYMLIVWNHGSGWEKSIRNDIYYLRPIFPKSV
mgnify:CR=1 FL=1